MNKYLIMRILSGIIVSSLLVLSLIFKGYLLKFLASFFILTGIYEYIKAFNNKGYNISLLTNFSIVSILIIKYIFFSNVNYDILFYINLLLILGLFYYFYDFFINKKDNITFFISVFGILYVAMPIFILFNMYINNSSESIYVWIIMIISIFTDIFAFIFGKNFGKNKLIEEISPNKTIEGAIGGIFGSLVAIMTYYLFIKNTNDIELIRLIFLAIFGSIFAQIGDIFASKLKRFCDIKDFGNIIPGHGGVLDRLDSIIFVTYLVCLLA